MMPPETILDRFVRNRPEFSSYGKLDIERVVSPLFQAFLSSFQNDTNEALRMENANASGGVEHPPFHFDYLDAADENKNAYAFQHQGFSFIVVTLPLVVSIFEVSQRLSRSTVAFQLLHLDTGTAEPDTLQGFLAQIQLLFLVSHEYTHHVHQHISSGDRNGVWTEFPHQATLGNIKFQAQELDADGYAAYLVLTHLLRGELRQSVLTLLERADKAAANCDELLLSCFFLAVLAFFCTFWHGNFVGSDYLASVYQLTHPPPPERIKYAIEVAKMWCGQFDSVPQSWFSPLRLQDLFRASTEAVGTIARQSWDAEISLLSSAEGARYDRLLFERFEAMRQSELEINP